MAIALSHLNPDFPIIASPHRRRINQKLTVGKADLSLEAIVMRMSGCRVAEGEATVYSQPFCYDIIDNRGNRLLTDRSTIQRYLIAAQQKLARRRVKMHFSQGVNMDDDVLFGELNLAPVIDRDINLAIPDLNQLDVYVGLAQALNLNGKLITHIDDICDSELKSWKRSINDDEIRSSLVKRNASDEKLETGTSWISMLRAYSRKNPELQIIKTSLRVAELDICFKDGIKLYGLYLSIDDQLTRREVVYSKPLAIVGVHNTPTGTNPLFYRSSLKGVLEGYFNQVGPRVYTHKNTSFKVKTDFDKEFGLPNINLVVHPTQNTSRRQDTRDYVGLDDLGQLKHLVNQGMLRTIFGRPISSEVALYDLANRRLKK